VGKAGVVFGEVPQAIASYGSTMISDGVSLSEHGPTAKSKETVMAQE
jgi:hypothetical protein